MHLYQMSHNLTYGEGELGLWHMVGFGQKRAETSGFALQ